MKITKRGYIARVAFNLHRQWPKDAVPTHAPTVAEMEAYPQFHFIKKERAEKFLLTIDATLTWMKNFPADATILKEILFGAQWNDVVKSFGGQEPEILIQDIHLDIKTTAPENLKVKLRYMIDENGKQITEEQIFNNRFFPASSKMDMLDSAIWTKTKRQETIDLDELFVRKQATIDQLDTQEQHEPQDKDSIPKREQKIFRLVEHEKALAMENVKEYEFRIRKMSDEQIEKEYRMEFGNDETL